MSTHDMPIDHRGLDVLDLDDCLARLRTVPVGRVAFVHEGEPVVLPVNHGVDGTDVVFRTTWGSKLEHARAADLVAFEADRFDEGAETGWSVLVSGTATMVYDDAEIARLDTLGVRPWARERDPWFWVRIRSHTVSGRQIH